MATLYITEFAGVLNIPGAIQIGMEPVTAEQTLAISGSTGSSSAFNGATKFVRLHTDAICSVTFGTAPSATTSKRRMAANQTEYYAIPAGQAFKVAVITNT